jgi:hypothetical protein
MQGIIDELKRERWRYVGYSRRVGGEGAEDEQCWVPNHTTLGGS